ncbi:MAG: DUF1501 domain-containing protein [Planctomycetota bacterium]|nr:DUF1501 domain-containing protein [Planctomycetota bacterium]
MKNDPLTRRHWMQRTAAGLKAAALTSLFSADIYGTRARAATSPVPHSNQFQRVAHRPGAAQSVIHLFMNGGPSQMDLFDPKPELNKRHGEAYFDQLASEVENPTAAGALMKAPYTFAQHGESGHWISDVLPHLSACADDLAVIKSMYTTNLTHEPALFKIHGGQEMPGQPALGSWVSYGLGTENQNLPAYVVLDDPLGLPVNQTQSWQAGYLPPLFQGTRFRSTGDPVLNLKRAFTEPDDVTQLERDLITGLDRLHQSKRPRQLRLDARIASYELAARMQMAATDVLDLSKESQTTLDMYGVGKEPTDSYGRRCLYARRLVERGVRFVQLFINFQIWDNHTGLEAGCRAACQRTDQPIAGLLKDLKQRGLLDSTLVVWGGEFGRLPIAQLPDDKKASNAGRDHNKNAMVTWMAGGGVQGGVSVGATDELGFAAVDNRITVADWHATILNQLGLDYEHLYFERNGLKDRLTGVEEARIIKEIL